MSTNNVERLDLSLTNDVVLDYQQDPATLVLDNKTIEHIDPVEQLATITNSAEFKGVQAHGGTLEEKLQEYRDNPNKPLPSCVLKLGITSVKQLIERMEGSDDATHREPTMRELREARKKDAENKVAKTKPGVITKANNNIEDKKEQNKNSLITKPIELLDSNKHEVLAIPKEILSKTVSEIIATAIKTKVSLGLAIEKPEVTLVEVPTSNQALSRTKATLEEQVPIIGAVQEVEREQLTLEINAENSILAEDFIYPVEQITKQQVIEATNIEIPNEVIDPPEEVLEALYLDIGIATETNGDATIVIASIMSELGIDYPETQEEVGNVEIAEELDPLLAAYAKKGMLNNEPELGDDELVTPLATIEVEPNLVIEGVETHDKEAKDLKVIDYLDLDALHQELTRYMTFFKPEEAEVVNVALESLIDVLQVYDAKEPVDEEKPSDIALITEIEPIELENLFVKLLDVLKLDYKDEPIMILLKEFYTAEIINKGNEELNIELLSKFGTREHKTRFGTSILAILGQMIKQNIGPFFRLGKYAVTASLV